MNQDMKAPSRFPLKNWLDKCTVASGLMVAAHKSDDQEPGTVLAELLAEFSQRWAVTNNGPRAGLQGCVDKYVMEAGFSDPNEAAQSLGTSIRELESSGPWDCRYHVSHAIKVACHINSGQRN